MYNFIANYWQMVALIISVTIITHFTPSVWVFLKDAAISSEKATVSEMQIIHLALRTDVAALEKRVVALESEIPVVANTIVVMQPSP